MLAAGCITCPLSESSSSISISDLNTFLQIVDTEDPEKIEPAARQLFSPGRIVPVQAAQLARFPKHAKKTDTMVYTLFDSTMENGYTVTMYLELHRRSGRVLSFYSIEI